MLIRFFRRHTYNGFTYMAGEEHDLRASDAEWLLRKASMSVRQPGVWEATVGAEALATENGIDLDMVRGSGKSGRIMQADVERVLRGEAGVGPVWFG